MIEFGGVVYYIDVDAIQKVVIPKGMKPTDKVTTKDVKTVTNEQGVVVGTETIESIRERGLEIDAIKFDTLRLMLETLIDYNDEIDDSLGADRALEKTPLAYKLAFNTLYHYGILKEKE